MAKKIEFKFSPKGYQEIMKSGTVQEILRRKAEAVRAAADAAYDQPHEWDIIADVAVGRTRARATVSGVPAGVEGAEGIMVRALGAAKGAG